MASNPMIRLYFSKFGVNLASVDALLFQHALSRGTASAKVAAFGWIGRAGHIALQLDPVELDVWVGRRDG